jgi:hypothetical protein
MTEETSRRTRATLIVLAVVCLGGCLTRHADEASWRQGRRAPADTYYAGIRFGMTSAEVKERVPDGYAVLAETSELVRVGRTLPNGNREVIEFQFTASRMVSTKDSTQ